MYKDKHMRNIAKKTFKENSVVSLISFTSLVILFLILLSIYSIVNIIAKETTFINYISLTITIVFAALLSPFLNGYFKLNYNMIKTGKGNLKDFFNYFTSFKSYFNTLYLNLHLLLRLALIFSIATIPFIVYYFAFNPQILAGDLILKGIGYTIFVSSYVFASIISLRYFFVYFLYENENKLPVNYYFKHSVKLARENSIYHQIVLITFSFTPWFLFSLFVIPIFYVIPYYFLTLTIFGIYNIFIITSNNKDMDNSSYSKNIKNSESNSPIA